MIYTFDTRSYLVREIVLRLKKNGTISKLNEKPHKLVNNFPYFSSNISFNKNHINKRKVKALTATDRLPNIGKFDIWKIKLVFLLAEPVTVSLYGCTTWNIMKGLEKKARWKSYKHASCYSEQILEAAPNKSIAA